MAEQVQTEEKVITVSPLALEKIREIKTAKEYTDHALRVFVQGGGCSGLQYGMGFDDNVLEDDTIVEYDDVKIIVDKISLSYIHGSNIDFVESMMGGGFAVNNPNAAASCGCGQSFSSSENSPSNPPAGCAGCG